jgi:hypothetical protein
MSHHRYPAAEIARRGDEIYDRSIRSEVEGKYDGKAVAIDVDTGFYALGETASAASDQVYAQNPAAEIWLVRVGDRFFSRFRSWPKRTGA